MTSSTRGTSIQSSSNASMSLKDWASFASLGPGAAGAGSKASDGNASDGNASGGDKADDTPPQSLAANAVTWIWAQEYPWDALQLRPTDISGDITKDDMPSDVFARLFGFSDVTPPSHLSQFGLDFVCRATWFVQPGAWAAEPQLDVAISGEFWQATHDKTAQKITITPHYFPVQNKTIAQSLHLEQLALQPITATGTSNGAVMAFAVGDFHYFTSAGAFAITTRANRLFVTGKNFTDKNSDLEAAVPAGAPGQTSPSLILYFKVLDLENEYDLILKHWVKSSAVAVAISVCINPPLDKNGNVDLSNPQIIRYVGETEGEGGDNNVTSIALRDLSFGTPDYHDYLQLGLNTVYVTLTAKAQQDYVLRALAVG